MLEPLWVGLQLICTGWMQAKGGHAGSDYLKMLRKCLVYSERTIFYTSTKKGKYRWIQIYDLLFVLTEVYPFCLRFIY